MVSTETGSLGLFPDEPLIAPHLDDFNSEENPLLEELTAPYQANLVDGDPLFKARTLLDELLDATCEIPLGDINDMATAVGVETTDLLAWATNSETCFVDWTSGHIRCQDEDVTQTEPPPETPPDANEGDEGEDDEGEDDGYIS